MNSGGGEEVDFGDYYRDFGPETRRNQDTGPGERDRPVPGDGAKPDGPQRGDGNGNRPNGPPPVDPSEINAAHYWVAFGRNRQVFRTSEENVLKVAYPSGDHGKTDLRTRSGFREAFHPTRSGAAIVAGVSIEQIEESLHPLRVSLVLGGSALFLVVILPAWWLTGQLLKPIGVISRSADKIIQGDYAERIETGSVRNELSSLADVLNESFGRLDDARRQATSVYC